jgi:hypothetical protein
MKVLEKKSQIIIAIWSKRLLVVAIMKSNTIRLKKFQWKNPIVRNDKRLDPNFQEDRLEDLNEGKHNDKCEDERTRATQESLAKIKEFQEIRMDNNEQKNFGNFSKGKN